MKALQPSQTIDLPKVPSPDLQFKILIVEDDSDVRLLYRMSLEDMHAPMSVRFACDGFEGLYLVGEMAPDLVIADLNMPGLDGFKMIRTLARAPSNMDIIVVTALSQEDIQDRGGLPDGIPVYTKPMPISLLQQLVKFSMQRKRNSRF
jgi:CheY-like chemotaxis protein